MCQMIMNIFKVVSLNVVRELKYRKYTYIRKLESEIEKMYNVQIKFCFFRRYNVKVNNQKLKF